MGRKLTATGVHPMDTPAWREIGRKIEKTAKEIRARKFKEQLVPAARCSDFDEDCATVTDHAACHRGVCRKIKGDIYHTDPADGYCPYLNGMIPR